MRDPEVTDDGLEPVFSIARPAYSIRSDLGHREPIPRVLAVALAVLLVAIRKSPPPMPHAPSVPAFPTT